MTSDIEGLEISVQIVPLFGLYTQHCEILKIKGGISYARRCKFTAYAVTPEHQQSNSRLGHGRFCCTTKSGLIGFSPWQSRPATIIPSGRHGRSVDKKRVLNCILATAPPQNLTWLSNLPPGIIFVAQNLLKFSLMPTTVYLVNYFLQHVLDVHIPKWVVILFGASILPSASLVDAFWATFNDSRNAEALGAVMPPMVKSRWPAGLDLLRRLIKYKDTDYPSQVFEDWVSQYGHVYNWRVLSKDRVCKLHLCLTF